MALEPIPQQLWHHCVLLLGPCRLVQFALVGALLTLAVTSTGEEASIGDWTVHYSVFNSTFLQPEIAQKYGIARARNLSVLNVSIHNAEGEAMDVPVSGTYRNLIGQEHSLSFKQVKEGDSCYFIATFATDNREKLHFYLQVVQGKSRHSIDFKKTVYHAK